MSSLPFTHIRVVHDWVVNNRETASPDTLMIVAGDFNKCDVNKHLTGYFQQVTCATKGDTTLDLLVCNVKDSYTSKAIAPSGRSDHNLVCVQPSNRSLVQQEPAITKTLCEHGLAIPEKSSAPRSKFRTGLCL